MSLRHIHLGKISRYILFGSGNLLVSTARHLTKAAKEVFVVTSPRHFDEKLTSSGLPLSVELKALGVPVLQTADVNECLQLREVISPKSLGLGFGPAWIFDAGICELFGQRFVNYMGIPLPRYLGGAHYTWQILSGDYAGGANFQLIYPKLYAGPVIFSKKFSFKGCRNPAEFFARAEIKEWVAMKEFLSCVFQDKKFLCQELNREQELFLPSLNTEQQGWVDWTWSGKQIESFINAFAAPYKGASTLYRGKRVYLQDARFQLKDGKFHPFQSGLIFRKSNAGICVATPGGSLLIQTVLSEKMEPIEADTLAKGARLFTPRKFLEEALQFEAHYNGEGLMKQPSPILKLVK